MAGHVCFKEHDAKLPRQFVEEQGVEECIVLAPGAKVQHLGGQLWRLLVGKGAGSDVAAPHAVCPATDAQPEDGARIPQLAFLFGSQ